MEGRVLVILALRLAGLLVVVAAVTTLLTSVPHFLLAQEQSGIQDDGLIYFAAYLAPGLLQLAAGLVLLLFPMQVAARVLRLAPAEQPLSINASQFERVAYAVLGAYFVIDGIEAALFVFARLKLYSALLIRHATIPPELDSGSFAMISVGLFKIAAGVLLILGGGVLAKWRGRLTG